jgi:deoxyribonuclease IV
MIHIGPSGTSGLGYEEGLRECARLKLDALEAAFTHGVHMSLSDAKIVGQWAKENNVSLSIHAPYFINLVSKEQDKIVASKKRIIDSCSRGHFFYTENSKRFVPIVFHPGYYQDLDKEDVYERIKHEVSEMIDVIEENKWNVILAPETTGKPTQFGDVDELLRLSKDTGCALTVDFAHLLARNNGVIDYEAVIKKLPDKFHAHYSGINYGPKGEKNHIPVDIKEFKKLVLLLEKYHKEVTIINESPDPFGDAEKMRKVLG